jgi:lipopolysaccharide/colanic/teichoic acid biosynthesis glycosyltransferase
MLGSMLAPASWERRHDQLVGLECLCNTAQMERVISREIARADRGGRGFTLVLFHVPSSQAKTDATRNLAETLLKRARLTDECGWFSEEYLAAVLTGTSPGGAQIFADGVVTALGAKVPPASIIYTYPFEPAGAGTSDGATEALNGARDRVLRRVEREEMAAALVAAATVAAVDEPEIEPSAPTGPTFNGKPRFSDDRSSETNRDVRAADLGTLLARPLPAWKRAIDIVGALVAIVIFSPLMIVAAILVRFSSPGPVVFVQKRSGLGGRAFRIYKFRTMVNGAEKRRKELTAVSEQDGPAFKLENDPRLTTIGRILRKTSIDELPQLFNVLKGDMSLVGPRPLPCGEQAECQPWQRHRMNVTPGLTCIWQVKGRSRVAFDDWIRMDVDYMRRRTFWRDVQIMFATIPAVLLRKGAK